jgi:hypothetical protein
MRSAEDDSVSVGAVPAHFGAPSPTDRGLPAPTPEVSVRVKPDLTYDKR